MPAGDLVEVALPAYRAVGADPNIHDALDPWLGKPKWKQTEGRVPLNYRFESEDVPPVGLKLKHFTANGLKKHRFVRLAGDPWKGG